MWSSFWNPFNCSYYKQVNSLILSGMLFTEAILKYIRTDGNQVRSDSALLKKTVIFRETQAVSSVDGYRDNQTPFTQAVPAKLAAVYHWFTSLSQQLPVFQGFFHTWQPTIPLIFLFFVYPYNLICLCLLSVVLLYLAWDNSTSERLTSLWSC